MRDLLQRVKLDPFEPARVSPAELALAALHHAAMRAADQSSSYRTAAGQGASEEGGASMAGEGSASDGGSTSALAGASAGGQAGAGDQGLNAASTVRRISEHLRTAGGLEVLADLVAVSARPTGDAPRAHLPPRWSLLHALELLNEASHPSYPENVRLLTAPVALGDGSTRASLVASLVATIRLCTGVASADAESVVETIGNLTMDPSPADILASSLRVLVNVSCLKRVADVPHDVVPLRHAPS